MIAAASLALLLAAEPALLPVSERRATYYVRRKRPAHRPEKWAPVFGQGDAQKTPPAVEAPAPRAVRTIPIIEWDAWYRRVGL